jgi:hypothetical protein
MNTLKKLFGTMLGLLGCVLLFNQANAGLIAHFDMEQNAAATQHLADSSPTGYALTSWGDTTHGSANAATPVPGVVGNALQFGGNDSYRAFGDIPADLTGAQNFTVSCWAKIDPTAPTWKMMFGTFYSGGGWGILYTGSPQLYIPGGGGVGASVEINDGEWHHVAVTMDNTTNPPLLRSTIYVDGLLSNYATGVAASAPVADFAVGGWPYNFDPNQFEGILDEIQIYDEALDEFEILAQYESGALRICDSASNAEPACEQTCEEVSDAVIAALCDSFVICGPPSNLDKLNGVATAVAEIALANTELCAGTGDDDCLAFILSQLQ